MGMMRLRFIGNKHVEPAPQARYAVLIERASDHTFLEFGGWTAPAAGSGAAATPPPGWVPAFVPRPAVPCAEIGRLGDATKIANFLDEVWWIDIDATNIPDDDYYVYFYSLTAREMQSSALMPVVQGDDASLPVRLKRASIAMSFNASLAGLPEPPAKGNGAAHGAPP